VHASKVGERVGAKPLGAKKKKRGVFIPLRKKIGIFGKKQKSGNAPIASARRGGKEGIFFAAFEERGNQDKNPAAEKRGEMGKESSSNHFCRRKGGEGKKEACHTCGGEINEKRHGSTPKK